MMRVTCEYLDDDLDPRFPVRRIPQSPFPRPFPVPRFQSWHPRFMTMAVNILPPRRHRHHRHGHGRPAISTWAAKSIELYVAQGSCWYQGTLLRLRSDKFDDVILGHHYRKSRLLASFPDTSPFGLHLAVENYSFRLTMTSRVCSHFHPKIARSQ